jgi:hypothetical protein
MASGISGKHRAWKWKIQSPQSTFFVPWDGLDSGSSWEYIPSGKPWHDVLSHGVTAAWPAGQSFTRHASAMPRRQRFQRWWKHPKSTMEQIMPKKHAIERDAPWPCQEKP